MIILKLYYTYVRGGCKHEYFLGFDVRVLSWSEIAPRVCFELYLYALIVKNITTNEHNIPCCMMCATDVPLCHLLVRQEGK